MPKPCADVSAGRLERLAMALLALAALIVWPASLGGPFQFDDWNVIVDQPAVHSLAAWWQSMPGIRPLLKLTYALDWQGPASAPAFHAFNLLLHAGNAVLLWRLLRHWPGLGSPAAGWVVLIFALHPVQTEAVSYISGRSMSLLAFFWLASACCWLDGRRRLAVLFFGLALASRETAWSLPFVLLVWQRARGIGWRQGAGALWPLWSVLAVAGLLIVLLPAYRRMLELALASRDPLSNLALQVHALGYLLSEPLLLWRNNIDPQLPGAARYDAGWWIGAGAIVGALVLAGRWLSRRPGLGLALLWPFLLLLPTNGVIARLDPAAERHLYLALIGPAVLLVLLLRGLDRRTPDGMSVQRRRPGRLSSSLLTLLLTGMAVATAGRINDYRSESALWEATAQRSPGKPRVWNNLGYAYLSEGRPELALPALRRAVALDPGFMRAQLNLERAELALEMMTRPPTTGGAAPAQAIRR